MTTAGITKARTTKAGTPPTTTFRRALKRALAACLCAALLPCAASAQAAPSEEVIETVRTSAGEFGLVRRRQGEAVTIVFKLNGKVVAEKESSEEGDAYSGASVRGKYPARAPRLLLVGLTTGALTCAAKFTVVDLTRQEAAHVTQDFGNCSDVPRAAYRGDALTVRFPAGPRKHDPGAHYVGPGQVWTYRAGRLRRAGR